MALALNVSLLVLLAAFMHALWNTVVKTGPDKLLAATLVNGTAMIIAVLVVPFVDVPNADSRIFLFFSVLLHGGYKFFLLQAYHVGDLSHVYPIARGTSPLVVAALSGVVAGEFLGIGEFFGVILVSIGLFSLSFQNGVPKKADTGPLFFAFATGLFISSYTLVDGLGVRRSGSPIGYIMWLYIFDGLVLAFFALLLRRGKILPYLSQNWKPGVFGGVMSFGAYGLVIWALSLGMMAHVAALRETSVIFASIIGVFYLGEEFGRRRLVASAIIASGVILLKAFR